MKIALFPLDVVLFPGAMLPLHIFEPRYREMIAVCLATGQPFGVVWARPEGMSVVGCTAEIVQVLERYADGRVDILTRGACRFKIEALEDSRSFVQANIDLIEEDGPFAARALREQAVAFYFEMLELSGEEQSDLSKIDLDRPVSFALSAMLPVQHEIQQQLLIKESDAERMEMLLRIFEAVLPKLRASRQANQAVKTNGLVM